MPEKGIKERLEQATSAQEVADLLETARKRSSRGMSADTFRKWRKIANRKLKQFSA